MRDEIWILCKGTALALVVAAVVYLAAGELLFIRDTHVRGLIAMVSAIVVVAIVPARE